MQLPDKYTRDFIMSHLDDDVHNLKLFSEKFPKVDIDLAIRQITGKQKTKKKIPEFFELDNILYPVKLSLEQSSSQITAKYKSKLFSGDCFIDLTGGFGIDFYFISSKFKRKIYVEKNEELTLIASHNFNVLNINNFEIINGNSTDIIDELPNADLIYLDPHRRSETGKKTFMISDCEPDVTTFIEKLMSKANSVLIKLSPMLDIYQAIKELKYVNEVHVLSVENDCKEVLFVLKKTSIDDIKIYTVNFNKTFEQHYNFSINSEFASIPVYTSEIECFIYEPNVALLKSGAFKSLAVSFDLKKLHANTHIFTSNKLIQDFPGRIFKLVKLFENNKTAIKEMKMKFPHANITLKNYPMSVAEFRKKTGIKDGGNYYIIGCQVNNGKYVQIICEKC